MTNCIKTNPTPPLSDNGIEDLKVPPSWVRAIIGQSPIYEYIAFGGKYITILKLLCDLKSDSNVLDLGCGCGRVTRPLYYYLRDGKYVGVDVNIMALAWCKKFFVKPNFRFIYADIINRAYNPTGITEFKDYKFPFEDEYFDILIAISVFTHNLPPWDEALKELARVTKKGGRFFATFMTIDNEPEIIGETTQKKKDFIPYNDLCHTRSIPTPEAGLSQKKDYIIESFNKAGFELKSFHWGNWAGKRDYLEHQDVFVFEKLS